MNRPIIFLGAGGHAKVLLDCLQAHDAEILGYVAPEASAEGFAIDYLGDDAQLSRYKPDEVALINAVGDIGTRRRVFEHCHQAGFVFEQVIHASAIISNNATLAEGVQVMAGAVIQPGACIGANAIINTRASVDHDCRIGAHTHVAVAAVLAGEVDVGEGVLIGAGSTIIPGIQIGDDSVVGAGATVICNVRPVTTVVGVPARPQ